MSNLVFPTFLVLSVRANFELLIKIRIKQLKICIVMFVSHVFAIPQ